MVVFATRDVSIVSYGFALARTEDVDIFADNLLFSRSMQPSTYESGSLRLILRCLTRDFTKSRLFSCTKVVMT